MIANGSGELAQDVKLAVSLEHRLPSPSLTSEIAKYNGHRTWDISTRFHFLSARFEPHASDMFFFFYNLLYSNSPRTFQLVQDSSWGAGFRQVAVLSASIDACRRAGNWEAVKGLDTGMGFGYRPSRFVVYTMEGCLFLVFLFRQVLELFLGSWFYAFLLLCLSASLLVCFSALPASFLFCFSAFPAPLLFCFCALP